MVRAPNQGRLNKEIRGTGILMQDQEFYWFCRARLRVGHSRGAAALFAPHGREAYDEEASWLHLPLHRVLLR